MGSPYSRAVNLLLYPSRSGVTTQFRRDEFQNLVPIVEPVEKPLKVYAIRENKEPDYLQEKGRDELVITFLCRSVSPKYLPPWIQSGDTIKAVYIEPQTRYQQEGQAVVFEITNSPWRAVQRSLGTSFKAYFTPGVRASGRSGLDPAATYQVVS